MKKFKCQLCGYIEAINELDSKFICPKCGAPSGKFELIKEEEIIKSDIEDVITSLIEEKEKVETQKIINANSESKRVEISQYNPGVVRIEEKCINCGQCKKTCENAVGMQYDLNICKNPICLSCGQCIVNCPTGALIPRYVYKDVKQIMDANEKIVVALVSPAVRVAIGECFGYEDYSNQEGKLVTALKLLGFDYVFDTTFGADLTVLEEVAELTNRIKEKKDLPQFTSCCPAWIKYAEVYHPELLDNISTCKSPIGMQSAIVKTYFCEQKNYDPSKVVVVAITPCTAKKMEAKEYVENVDYVITTSELGIFIKEENIKFTSLNETDFDKMIGKGSGAGVIFGNTGGVMEASMRTLYRIMTNKNPTGEFLEYKKFRGIDDIKEAKIDIDGNVFKVAVVDGMPALEQLLKDNKYKKFHYIEVMNCKGGCSGGGGQPLCALSALEEVRINRMDGLYKADTKRKVRCSYNNDEIKELYLKYLKKPQGEMSTKLLKTSYSDKSNLLNGNF